MKKHPRPVLIGYHPDGSGPCAAQDLLHGRRVYVSLEDALLLRLYYWTAKNGQGRKRQPKWYAFTTKYRNGKRTSESLHRLVLKQRKGLVTHHINGDTLDNRRCNLRVVTVKENNRNRWKRA